jgi:cell division transport system permease protein
VTLPQALAYFLREAMVNLMRSWKVSLVAVTTIAVSLFVGGAFLLVSGNLAVQVDRWRRETKVVVYLDSTVSESEVAALAAEAQRESWVTGVEVVRREEALARFQELFPSLADLVEGWREDPLPASVEIAFDPEVVPAESFAGWLGQLRNRSGVLMVDDDREWLAQLGAILALGRGVGLSLGLVLLLAAVFTIASVVRLTAYLYHDEIAIMRLVGATEFFIRGPFYAEGLLQGLAGGLLAALGILAGYHAVAPRAAVSIWGAAALGEFLSPAELLTLVLLGAGGGLFGAIASLRRERLGQVE